MFVAAADKKSKSKGVQATMDTWMKPGPSSAGDASYSSDPNVRRRVLRSGNASPEKHESLGGLSATDLAEFII